MKINDEPNINKKNFRIKEIIMKNLSKINNYSEDDSIYKLII